MCRIMEAYVTSDCKLFFDFFYLVMHLQKNKTILDACVKNKKTIHCTPFHVVEIGEDFN